MNHNITFEYTDGKSVCTIDYKGIKFTGTAYCHPDDEDFKSERVGLCIAEARANIKVLRFKKNFEIMPQLQILEHLYHNIQRGKYYNENSYETKMLRSQIRAIEKELAVADNDLAEEEQYLNEYITNKEKLYKKLRAKHQ